MPIGACAAIASRLRSSLRHEPLNSSIDITILLQDHDLGIAETLKYLFSEATLSQARFPRFSDIGNTLCSHWTFLTLPLELATQLAIGHEVNLNDLRFPCGQLNLTLNPIASLMKAYHWFRQGVFTEEQLEQNVGLLVVNPTLIEASSRPKSHDGRDGQANWHNCS